MAIEHFTTTQGRNNEIDYQSARKTQNSWEKASIASEPYRSLVPSRYRRVLRAKTVSVGQTGVMPSHCHPADPFLCPKVRLQLAFLAQLTCARSCNVVDTKLYEGSHQPST
jgi:hypothetical protein